jgi:hypothetical protein
VPLPIEQLYRAPSLGRDFLFMAIEFGPTPVSCQNDHNIIRSPVIQNSSFCWHFELSTAGEVVSFPSGNIHLAN